MMQTPDEKTIECCVTFLSAEEGGRTHPFGHGALSNYRYRPHFVVVDPNQLESKLEKNVIQEEYLGVAFILGPDIVENNQPLQALVCLVYPNVDYSQLTVGATFTIREGGRIVGHGEVIKAA